MQRGVPQGLGHELPAVVQVGAWVEVVRGAGGVVARGFSLVAGGAAGLEPDKERVLVQLQIGRQNPAQLQDGNVSVSVVVQTQRPGVSHVSCQGGAFELEGECFPAQLEPYAGDEQPGVDVRGQRRALAALLVGVDGVV